MKQCSLQFQKRPPFYRRFIDPQRIGWHSRLPPFSRTPKYAHFETVFVAKVHHQPHNGKQILLKTSTLHSIQIWIYWNTHNRLANRFCWSPCNFHSTSMKFLDWFSKTFPIGNAHLWIFQCTRKWDATSYIFHSRLEYCIELFESTGIQYAWHIVWPQIHSKCNVQMHMDGLFMASPWADNSCLCCSYTIIAEDWHIKRFQTAVPNSMNRKSCPNTVYSP